jgi:hypothetical protein
LKAIRTRQREVTEAYTRWAEGKSDSQLPR